MASISQLPTPVDLDLSVATSLSNATLRQRIAEYGDCLEAPEPDEWFPNEPTSEEARTAYEQTARELCADCPVIAECLERALRLEAVPYVVPHGIFGGTAPWTRRAINRNRRRRAYAGAMEVSA
ncbi:hypothetical protein GCM10023191_102320 [Actinoallomurus oryzae]|uniref:4Fe-4S Wbl-type domain-containing protein n=1 Tax=Actinoallomurus oryzae TaxID=502180 RepID=A0ABP8R9T3_9ACTN